MRIPRLARRLRSWAISIDDRASAPEDTCAIARDALARRRRSAMRAPTRPGPKRPGGHVDDREREAGPVRRWLPELGVARRSTVAAPRAWSNGTCPATRRSRPRSAFTELRKPPRDGAHRRGQETVARREGLLDDATPAMRTRIPRRDHAHARSAARDRSSAETEPVRPPTGSRTRGRDRARGRDRRITASVHTRLRSRFPAIAPTMKRRRDERRDCGD